MSSLWSPRWGLANRGPWLPSLSHSISCWVFLFCWYLLFLSLPIPVTLVFSNCDQSSRALSGSVSSSLSEFWLYPSRTLLTPLMIWIRHLQSLLLQYHDSEVCTRCPPPLVSECLMPHLYHFHLSSIEVNISNLWKHQKSFAPAWWRLPHWRVGRWKTVRLTSFGSIVQFLTDQKGDLESSLWLGFLKVVFSIFLKKYTKYEPWTIQL